MDAQNKRTAPRYSCMGNVTVDSRGTTLSGRLLNLSIDGCLLELQPYRFFEIDIEIEVVIRTKTANMRVKGAVRRIPRNQGPVGIRFNVMTQRGKNELKELIFELEEENALRHARTPGSVDATLSSR